MLIYYQSASNLHFLNSIQTNKKNKTIIITIPIHIVIAITLTITIIIIIKHLKKIQSSASKEYKAI